MLEMMPLIQTRIPILIRQDSSKLLIDLEAVELTPRLLQNKILHLDGLAAWEKLLIEWEEDIKPRQERELEKITNDDTSDPPIGDGTPPAGSTPQGTTILGYPKTTEQMQDYWRMVGLSINEPFSTDNYYILRKEKRQPYNRRVVEKHGSCSMLTIIIWYIQGLLLIIGKGS